MRKIVTKLCEIETEFSFYIHGSVQHESNLIIVQQDATVFSLLYFCRRLYMFRVLPSSGGRTTVITASGTGQPVILPSALVELEQRKRTVAVLCS